MLELILTLLLNELVKRVSVFGFFIDVAQIFLTRLIKFFPTFKLNKWFVTYLSNNYQLVKITGKPSNFSAFNCSIPQKSITGPILFLFFNGLANKLLIIDPNIISLT